MFPAVRWVDSWLCYKAYSGGGKLQVGVNKSTCFRRLFIASFLWGFYYWLQCWAGVAVFGSIASFRCCLEFSASFSDFLVRCVAELR